MRKILITGGTGFIGARFVYKFLELNDAVHLLVRPKAKFWRIEPIQRKLTLHTADITQKDEVDKLVLGLKPDIILHFAVYGAHSGAQTDTKTMLDTNVLGTINLINACSKIPFTCFINTGSSSEYGEKDESMKEYDLLAPNNLYGITKAAATNYCQHMAKTNNLPIITMRLFSPYGPYEDKTKLFPAIINAHLTGSALRLSSPSSVRDFVFIDDVVSAYLEGIKKIDMVRGNIFNVGSGVQHSIKNVVTAFETVIGQTIHAQYETFESSQHEPKCWVADISKAKKLLCWEPKVSIEDGLRKDIEWLGTHRKFYE